MLFSRFAIPLILACGALCSVAVLDGQDRSPGRKPSGTKPSAAGTTGVPATIGFADGKEIRLTNIEFRYIFGSSDSPPKEPVLYTPTEVTCQRLCFSRRENGGSKTYDFPLQDVKRVKFTYRTSEEKSSEYCSIFKDTTIELKDGRVFETDRGTGLFWDCKPLTKRKHTFNDTCKILGEGPGKSQFERWFTLNPDVRDPEKKNSDGSETVFTGAGYGERAKKWLDEKKRALISKIAFGDK